MVTPTLWSLKELKKIKEILVITPSDNIDEIQKQLNSTKTKDQIKNLIGKLRISAEKAEKKHSEAPIESWIKMVSQLVFREDVDQSENLARIMSLISEYEDFSSCSGKDEFKPNYKLIYNFLAEILQGSETLPILPAVESAIVLDLMHSLADVLKTKNTAVHQQIMQWKHKLLMSKIDIYNKNKQTELFRKALTNDYSDLLKPPGKSTNPNPRCEKTDNQNPQLGRKRKIDDSDPGSSSTQVDFDGCDGQHVNASELSEHQEHQEHQKKPFVKPKLFTINPFCIPVTLLKLKDSKK